jgi:hypothetical protein
MKLYDYPDISVSKIRDVASFVSWYSSAPRQGAPASPHRSADPLPREGPGIRGGWRISPTGRPPTSPPGPQAVRRQKMLRPLLPRQEHTHQRPGGDRGQQAGLSTCPPGAAMPPPGGRLLRVGGPGAPEATLVHPPEGWAPFPFAGLWEHWDAPDGSPVDSWTMITTTSDEPICGICGSWLGRFV